MDMGVTKRRQLDDLYWTDLYLEMRLDNSYFIGEGGRPVLKCTAQVSTPQVNTLYQQETQISLGPRVGDPVPERGNIITLQLIITQPKETFITNVIF